MILTCYGTAAAEAIPGLYCSCAVCETVALLKGSGGLKSDSVCIINHFSHNGGATHEQLEQEARQRGWTAAYDGIRIEIC